VQLNFVFWNVGKRKLDDEIVSLAGDTQPDFLVLAEYEGDETELLKRLTRNNPQLNLIPKIACDRITLFSTCSPSQVHPKRETARFTIQEVQQPGTISFLLGLVHLPSKLHETEDDQLHSTILLRSEIEAAEADVGHSNTLVLGDFNMNPFDKGMVFVSAMNAISCLTTAKRQTRIFHGQTQSFFYNPSWNLLGDFSETPGTFYHNSPGALSYYWNTLDQVVMRPTLANTLDKSTLRIVRSVRGKSLVSDNGIPSTSDHLPITFTVNLTNGGII
jgi:endonuclease/exonuclease/phosphatase family metal-dependent hydrolase